MSPATRRNGGGPRSSQPRRKISAAQQQRQEINESILPTEIENNVDENAMEVDEPSVYSTSQVERVVFPLRRMAERVGKEVETFAEELDKLRPKFESTNVEMKRGATLELVAIYRDTADRAAKRLRQVHGDDLKAVVSSRYCQDPGQEQWQPEIPDDINETTYKDLERWQDESRTWQLVHNLLACESSQFIMDAVRGDNDKFHADGERWIEFLGNNKGGQERLIVLKWLESAAEETGEDLALIEEALQRRSKRSLEDGWGDTREKIKAEKRLRFHDVPIELAYTDAPPIKNSEGAASLVTQLDPDAVTRQNWALEKDDVQFERDFWFMIWQMLRRGHPMHDIREWCNDLGQQARGLSLGALSANNSQQASRRFLWRQACFRLSRDGGLNEYERAAFGLLSGDERSVEPVCLQWNDFVFVHINSKLTKEYESWLVTHHAQDFQSEKNGKFRMPTRSDAGQQDFISEIRQFLSSLPSTDVYETASPLQAIQAALIGHNMTDYIFHQGVAMSRTVEKEDNQIMSRLVTAEAASSFRNIEFILDITDDHDALRVLAHLYIIFKELGHDFGEGERLRACENVLQAYIQYLSGAGKFELIPGYAAQLSWLPQINTLARICQQIKTKSIRKEFINLMRDAGINEHEVLSLHTELTFRHSPFTYPAEKDVEPCAQIELMKPEADHKWPGQRIKTFDKSSRVVQDYEKLLIESVEWFMLVDGDWARAFDALSEVALAFLKAGRFQAAIDLFRTMPFADLSIAQSFTFIGKSVDVMDDHEGSDEESVPDLRRSSRRKTRVHGKKLRALTPDETKVRRDLLKSQAKTYFELEQLVNGLSAIMAIGEKEEGAKKISDAYPRDDAAFADAKKRHKPYIDELVSCMEPLLHEFLVHPSPYIPAKALEAIRHAYLPEMVIAYNSALHFAGYLQTREHLLQCLDLATDISANDELIACFKAAKAPKYQRRGFIDGEWDEGEARNALKVAKSNGFGNGTAPTKTLLISNSVEDRDSQLGDDGHGNGRMKELVDSFALASKAVLDLNEKNNRATSTKKIRKGGRTLGIWDISG